MNEPPDEREHLRAELARLAPLAELGRMAATVTHEIRNPLAGISANAELLRESLTDPRDIELVDTILAEVRRLGDLVTDLLYYCRERPAQRQPIDLAAVTRACLELSRPAAEAAGVRLSWSGAGLALGDADLSRQALLNVMRNAIQACSAGGCVQVFVEEGRILVRDTGHGVPEALRDTLFEPFVTGRTRGLGLGATVARRCQRRQDGDLILLDTGPQGSVFALTWPRCAG
ncbi:MAG: histidine kinase dimerization/phospho-acceptor domain-containing protein [Planctomycetota bacterium]|nr:histidine kinase dimerization/phospho-acceptor domain-containing protein [Planctomycetota bacterium]